MMLLAEQMAAALDRARTLTQLDHISRDVWRGHGAGQLGDEDAQALAERLEACRKAVRREIKPIGIPPGRNTIFPPRRPQASPDRRRSRERRRSLAADRPLPPQLAVRFTEGQRAILHIVGDEVRVRGSCSLCIDIIAAWAGTCRRHVQSTIREAARLGLLVIQERRREGRKNETNIVRIISREWLAWLRLHHGCKMIHPTETNSERKKKQSGLRPQLGYSRKDSRKLHRSGKSKKPDSQR